MEPSEPKPSRSERARARIMAVPITWWLSGSASRKRLNYAWCAPGLAMRKAPKRAASRPYSPDTLWAKHGYVYTRRLDLRKLGMDVATFTQGFEALRGHLFAYNGTRVTPLNAQMVEVRIDKVEFGSMKLGAKRLLQPIERGPQR